MTWVFARVMLVNFGYFLSLGMMNPILPRFIAGPLHGSKIAVGLAVGSFTVVSLLLRPFSGRLGDRRGRKIGIVFGASAHTFACGGMIFATSLAHVVGFRMLTGFAEAFLFVGAATAIQDMAPDDRRGEAASLFSLSLFTALAIGPTIGELLLDSFGFHAVWKAAAASVGLAAALALTLPDTRSDVAAAGTKVPLIHRAALRPGFPLACAIWGLAAFQSFVPLYGRSNLHLHGVKFVFLANSLTILFLRSVGARIPDRVGPLRMSRFALAFTPVGLAVMGLWASVTGLVVGAVVLACGQAFAFPSLMTIAVNNAPATERGSVIGTFTAYFDLSFGGGAILLGVVAQSVGYRGGFLTAMAVAAVGAISLYAVPPPVRRIEVGTGRVIAIGPPGE
jgi:MFS family permease